MYKVINKKTVSLFIPLTVLLVFGLSFNLSRAQSSEDRLSEPLLLASAQLSERQIISPAISMDFQDADLKDVLKVFSQQAGLNFIASENIKDRKLTLYLDAVSVQDALNTIMSANNLTYEQQKDSKIFVVKEWGKPDVETITRIFPLQYARVKGYELTTEGEEAKKSEEIGIKEVIGQLLTEYGRVIEDSRTNSLIVSDVPSQFTKIEKAIKELDVRLPQVMIEAEIIEASLDTIDKLGIIWGTSGEGELASAYGASQSLRFPFTKDSGNPRIGPGGDVSGLYMGYVSAMNLGGILAMLNKDTDTRILARPKILTLNNETAEIKITADTAIGSLTVTTSQEGLGESTVSAERVKTGVALKVIPQINREGLITMTVEPSVTNTKWSEYFSGTFVDPQTRTAKTTVTIRDGETIIIGGLIDTEDSKSLRKVPFLGDIPLIGNVFRKKDNKKKDKELIIFITPHLIKERMKTAGLASQEHLPGEYESFGLEKEEAMERILDRFEE